MFVLVKHLANSRGWVFGDYQQPLPGSSARYRISILFARWPLEISMCGSTNRVELPIDLMH
jgi:hypothetical protein